MTDTNSKQSHSLMMGFILWIFGFMGSHRFYYGRPVSGTIYFCTAGLLFIGWIVDLFLMKSLCDKADLQFRAGALNYNIAWVLLTFLGAFGIHRFYMGKFGTGLLYLLTGGLLGLGVLYDFWYLNDQIDEINAKFAES